MGLTRINTKDGLVIELDGKQARLTKAQMSADAGRATVLETEITRQLGKSLSKPIFFHKNRSGTVDVYTGKIPDMYPEDVEKPK